MLSAGVSAAFRRRSYIPVYRATSRRWVRTTSAVTVSTTARCGAAGCAPLRRLAEILTVHSVGPLGIDRAEAWRRADTFLGRDARPVAIAIHEFRYGFVAWPTYGRQNDFVLVIDRHTGGMTRWPRVPLATLTRQYGDYLATVRPHEREATR